MNAALERMVNEVSTDPKLLQVLKSISSEGAVVGKRDGLEERVAGGPREKLDDFK